MKITAYLSLIIVGLSLLFFRYLHPPKNVRPALITAAVMPKPVSVPVPKQTASELPIVPIPRKVPWPKFPTNPRNNEKKKRRKIR